MWNGLSVINDSFWVNNYEPLHIDLYTSYKSVAYEGLVNIFLVGSNVFHVTWNEFLTEGDHICSTVKREEF